MERLTLKIELIKPLKNSYKRVDLLLFEKLKISIRNFGQLKPINCLEKNGEYFCFEGKQILKAMNDVGLKDIEVNLHKISDEDSKYIQLLMNDLNFLNCDFDLSVQLSSFIRIKNSLIPMSQLDIDSMLQLHDFDWEEFSRREPDSQIDLLNILNEDYR